MTEANKFMADPAILKAIHGLAVAIDRVMKQRGGEAKNMLVAVSTSIGEGAGYRGCTCVGCKLNMMTLAGKPFSGQEPALVSDGQAEGRVH